ncbi:two-component response regulator ORR9-like [Mangifera indica]|uniref:two-component response regulator ORR9-like n=1 Tax=Mangifera indica TaxID=29780 RepID=UPI001CFBCACC|nr:two-component response regulator ORR9-like [Mangifera indica]
MELKSESVEVEDTEKKVILLEQQHEEKQQQKLQQSFHVLAVDDSVIDRKLLEKLLKVSSYQVTCVDSGDKALEFLGLIDKLQDTPADSSTSSSSSPPHSLQQQEGSKVNLIMTDFCMPGMSGYDLLKRVKGSSWKDVPVVVMSSENVPSRISMCLEEGAEEFLLKPLQLLDLEKLQPHLLKSLNMNNQTTITMKASAPFTEMEQLTEGNNNNESKENNNNKESNSYINSNNSFSKRKALSAEPPERRPKMKELAVV